MVHYDPTGTLYRGAGFYGDASRNTPPQIVLSGMGADQMPEKVNAKIHRMGPGMRGGALYGFHCPACGYGHCFEIEVAGEGGWEWNGSLDKPTFSPSLLVNKDHPESRCHSMVRDGKIQFFEDSWHHAFGGEPVDLPDWDE